MAQLQEVRAIFFDAVGTLIHPDPPAAVVYAEVGRRHGSRLHAGEMGRRFATAFAREEALDRAHTLQTSEDREVQRWRTIVAAVLDDVTDDACFAELYQHFSQPQAWRCEAGTARLLETLAGRGYVLGLASNYDQRLRRVVEGLPELRAVRPLVISSEVGWRKPALAFFAAAVASVELAPPQVLFVGDDRANDFEGARAAGCRAVLFDPDNEEPAVAECVRRLENLLDLLPGAQNHSG
ncbi:MAG: HAD family hydrolase [Gemmataceae bacterium]|nr:HAD family hydrolase [Gemmataceae bacterium]